MKDKRLIHYWICEPCANKMGGVFPEGHVCTVCRDVCKYCESEDVVVIPWIDFDWQGVSTAHLRD